MASTDDLGLLLAKYHADIPFFALSAFGTTLNPKQIEFVRAFQNNSQISFRGGIGFGKTFSMAVLIIWALICHNDVQVTIFGPSEDQIKAGIWKEVGNLYGKLPPFLKEVLEYKATSLSRVDQPTGAFAETRLANKDNIETARGIHQINNFVFVDEATGVPDAVFAELQNIFTDPNPKLCIISNPSKTSGFFFDSWEHPEVSAVWTKVHGKLTDNPGITPERLASITASFGGVGSNEYRVKVLGEFPLEDEDGVIPRESVVEAINRDVTPVPGYPVIWGFDPSGTGKDRSVLVKRRDNTMLGEPVVYGNMEPEQLAARIRDEFDRTPKADRPAEICVDALGVGHGIAGLLRVMGLPVKDIIVSNKARDPDRFVSLRDELWFKAKDWFATGNVSIPNNPVLVTELCLPSYEFVGSKYKVQSKKDIRKQGRKSPDLADALCLTFASDARHTQFGKYAWNKPINLNRGWSII
ncbi:hypothetical protein [Methylorubrum thiocyanatum]|uniref:hypothetical protein n=1 Tax=Methylorubrum thiocyanatum TaxID=47958 RepID=UPI003F80D820